MPLNPTPSILNSTPHSAAVSGTGGGGSEGEEGSRLSRLQQYSKECHLDFLRSPVQIKADSSTGRVSNVTLEVNKLEVSDSLMCVPHNYHHSPFYV